MVAEPERSKEEDNLLLFQGIWVVVDWLLPATFHLREEVPDQETQCSFFTLDRTRQTRTPDALAIRAARTTAVGNSRLGDFITIHLVQFYKFFPPRTLLTLEQVLRM